MFRPAACMTIMSLEDYAPAEPYDRQPDRPLGSKDWLPPGFVRILSAQSRRKRRPQLQALRKICVSFHLLKSGPFRTPAGTKYERLPLNPQVGLRASQA